MEKWPQELTALMALGTHLPADLVGRGLRRTGRRKWRCGRRSRYFPNECANDRGKHRANMRMFREIKPERRRR